MTATLTGTPDPDDEDELFHSIVEDLIPEQKDDGFYADLKRAIKELDEKDSA